MKYIAFFSFLLSIVYACENKTKESTIELLDTYENPSSSEKIALNFINSYVEFCESDSSDQTLTEWVNYQDFISSEFTDSLNALVEREKNKNPDLGLDYDPIFNAQDYPSEGFEFKCMNTSQTIVTLCGKEWQEFEVKVKLSPARSNMVIVGAGAINMND